MAQESPVWLTNFVELYQKMGTDNIDLLNSIYHQEVEFTDAVHSIHGLDQLYSYFEHLYTNIKHCQFVIHHYIYQGDQAAVYWQMNFVHPSLNKGKPISIEGHSLIKGRDDKVVYHKDYFDMGAMVYEHIPVLGRIVKAIKLRMNTKANA